MDETADIAIVGAAMVGIATAAHLAEAGLKVVVFDRTGLCEETSSGNAARRPGFFRCVAVGAQGG
jgi:D-amino-acid dehydrogenase